MARFASRYRSHRLVMRPARQVRDEAGRVVDYVPGRDIVFTDHIYETEDPEEIHFIRTVGGSDVIEITGFDAVVEPKRVEVVSAATAAPVTAPSGAYRCDSCGKAFGSSQALALHRTRVHGAEAAVSEHEQG